MTEEQEDLVMDILIGITRDWGIVDQVIHTLECKFCRRLRYWDTSTIEDAMKYFPHEKRCAVSLGRRLRQTIREIQTSESRKPVG